MAVNKSSVAYMKDYLKYALDFEKYVYIWSTSMNNANDQMRSIYFQRNQLENIRDSAHKSIVSLDTRYSNRQRHSANEAIRYKKKAHNSLIVLIIDLLICLMFGIWMFNFGMRSDNDLSVTAILILSIIATVVFYIFTFVGPIATASYTTNKSNYKKSMAEADSSSINSERRRQEIILKEKEKQADNDYKLSIIEETELQEKQNEISTALQSAKKNLAQVYSEDVLPAKYRNLTAVATLYEYLETGRCNTIQGHGGIYDTYEVEKIAMERLRQQIITNQTLSRIEDNQRYICQELRQANQTLSRISSSLSEIEKTNAEIAKNTAISAVANQQTAAATSWLAWNAWANGY